jgi:RNA-directed DNA polymerase
LDGRPLDGGANMIDDIGDLLPGVFCLFVVSLIIYSVYSVLRNKGSGHRSQRGRKFRKRRELTLRDLAVKLKLPQADLVQHMVQYDITAIAKRNGGKRILYVPDRATKHLQRKLLQRLIGRLSIHDKVHGFRKGHSIVDNAAEHVGREVIVKLDIVDFFPSTSSKRVEYAFRGAGFNQKTAAVLAGLTCYEGGLPQGAPTSPALSNYVNKNMDKKLYKLAIGLGARYTRYADDLTFSFLVYSREDIHSLLISTGKILNYYGYRLNSKKKRIIRQHRQQLVTGLVVNERVNLPRKTRRWLRSVGHRIETGGKATLTNSEFRGWLSLLKMVDAESPLLAFLDFSKIKEETNAAPVPQIDAVKPYSDGRSSTSNIALSVMQQDKPVSDCKSRPTKTPPKTHFGISSVTIAPADGRRQFLRLAELEADGNLNLIQIIEALDRTEKYSTNRKEAEKNLAGSEYLLDISVSSIGRTFSFNLQEDYQDGQTLKGTLRDGGLKLELYCDKEVGSKLVGLRLPTQLKVLVRVIQWNSVFKRIEAVVLHTTL